MKTTKKILAAVLLVCMLASLLPAGAALAASTDETPAPGASSESTTVPTTEPTVAPTTEPTVAPTTEPSTEPTEHVHTWVNGVCSGCNESCWHAKLDNNGKCEACGAEFDAMIGETLYATLQEAIKAAPVPDSEKGETVDNIAATVITVLGDVPQPVDENNEKLSVVINEGRSVTLDLNGHTLNCPIEADAAKLVLTDSNTDKGYKGSIAPEDGCALTLKNGAKVEINEDITLKGSPAISQTGGGELIIEDGRINGDIKAESGAAAIYGGVFTAEAESISAFLAEDCETATNEDAATAAEYLVAVVDAAGKSAEPEAQAGSVTPANAGISEASIASAENTTASGDDETTLVVSWSDKATSGSNAYVTGLAAALTDEGKEKILDKSDADTDALAAAKVELGAVVEESARDSSSRTYDVTAKAYVTYYDKNNNEIKSETVTVKDEWLNGNELTVVLPCSFTPGEIVHTVESTLTQTTEETYKSEDTAAEGEKTFSYSTENKNVTLTAATLGEFKITAKDGVITESDTLTIDDSSPLPYALTNRSYSYIFSASGSSASSLRWELKDGSSLPDGLELDKDGIISGTPTTAGTYTFTVTVHELLNSENSAEKEFELTVYEPAAQVLDGTTVLSEYATAAEAVENASAGQTVKLIKNVDEDIIVSKNVTLEGAGHSANSVTVKSGVTATVKNLDAESLTAESGANVTLKGSNDVSTVTNNGTMRIESGHYGTLGGSGSYTVTGGTYDKEVPMKYCREVLSDGSIKQRCSKYNSLTKVYEITDFELEITYASNSAYHMPGSLKTIDFTLNLPYELADIISVEIDDGSQRKAISGRYYELSEDSNGYTVVSLKANALNALSEGKYKFIYNDEVGSDWMYFHVSSTVKTGDTSNIGLWAGIAGGSSLVLCAIAAVLIIRNKKKKGNENPSEDKK